MTALAGMPNFKDGGFNTALFDLDGTLIDSMWIWDRLMIDFAERHKITTPEYVMNEVAHMSMVQSSVYVRDELGLNMTADEIYAEWTNDLREAYAFKIKTKPGAEQYLKFLKEINVKIGLVTACDRELSKACLKNNGIYDLFDALIYVDDVGKGKNFPDIFEKSLEILGCKPSESVLFDDIAISLRTAKKLGITTVAVEDNPTPEERKYLLKEADYYIKGFK